MCRAQREQLHEKLGKSALSDPIEKTIEQIRVDFAEFMKTMNIPSGTRITTSTLRGQRTLVIEAEENVRSGAIIYFHGGSYLMGSPETGMSLTASLVKKTGIKAFFLDYRLAPEFPFPTAIEDCTEAYRDLLE